MSSLCPAFPLQLLQYGRWSMSVSWGCGVRGFALLQFVGGSFLGVPARSFTCSRLSGIRL